MSNNLNYRDDIDVNSVWDYSGEMFRRLEYRINVNVVFYIDDEN